MPKDPVEAAANQRAYVLANPEKVAATRAKWRRDNPERARQVSKDSSARRRTALKAEMIAVYGGGCTCCGEKEPLFMAMDHVNGRTPGEIKTGAWAWGHAKKQGWPDTYTVLCHNCNLGRQFNNGVCPHKTLVVDDGVS